MKSVIRFCSHKGDSVVAEFDPSTEDGCKVAQHELTKFLEDCITKYGSKPPVWSRRISESANKFEFFRTNADEGKVTLLDPVNDVAEFLIHMPLVGG